MESVEVQQSQGPISIDEIVSGSVQQVQDTLIAISAVTGMVIVLAKFKMIELKPSVPAPIANGQVKKRRGRRTKAEIETQKSNSNQSQPETATPETATVQ